MRVCARARVCVRVGGWFFGLFVQVAGVDLIFFIHYYNNKKTKNNSYNIYIALSKTLKEQRYKWLHREKTWIRLSTSWQNAWLNKKEFPSIWI